MDRKEKTAFYSSDEEKKYRKKHKKHSSPIGSPQRRERHRRHRSRSHSPGIKQEPESPPPRQRVKQERGERDGYDYHRPIKREPDDRHQEVKRKPRDDQRRERRRNDERRMAKRRERTGNPFQESNSNQEFGTQNNENNVGNKSKEKPSLELSGKLAEDTNIYKGVVIKYNQPPEARKPKTRWRFYPFKGDEALPMLQLHRQSAYLIGRDRKVVDIPVDHPSCSKQHAVLQYRIVEYQRADGSSGRRVRPYVIDLGSANGTFVNNKKIEAERFVELMEKDVVKFGFSTREYVLLHEKTDTSEVDDGGASD